MIRGSEIVGLPIICLEEGCKDLEVKDLLYCNRAFEVKAFIVQEGSYFHNIKMIRFENVLNIGEDAITIQNKGVVEKLDHISDYNFHSREALLGVEILTEDGNNVGIVQDLMIDRGTGRLMGLVVAEGLFDDLMEGRSILPLQDSLSLDKNTIIITQSLNQAICHPTGGLKKLFSLE